MGVKVEWHGEEFERKFMEAIGNEMVKAGMVFRRNLQVALQSEGKSPPPSPHGSKIPYADTGHLANRWKSSSQARKTSKTLSVAVATNVMYAKWLVVKTGKGKRNYLDEGLAWRRKTSQQMLKLLDAKRLIATAVRSLKK